MTEIVVALLMFLNGNMIEYTYKNTMSDCLKSKRTVERSVNPENVRMQCGEVDAIIEKDEDTGRYRVVKIVKDKYDSTGYTK